MEDTIQGVRGYEPPPTRAYQEAPATPTEPSPYVNLPSGELTNTVILGALLAILGNNLLKPLFNLVLENFKNDQKAPGQVVEILKERITALEQDKGEVVAQAQAAAEEHSRYLRSLDVHNEQAAQIATILGEQTNRITALSDRLDVLASEVRESNHTIIERLGKHEALIDAKPVTLNKRGLSNG